MERGVLLLVFMFFAFIASSQQRIGFGYSLETEQAEIKVFPNPATDYFQISHIPQAKRVVVRNIASSVRTFSYVPNSQYDIADLPAGEHSVVVLDEKGKILKVLRLQVGAYRP